MRYPEQIHDRQLVYYTEFEKRLRRRLRLLITPELIEEHRKDPAGHHSDALERVLNYYRRSFPARKIAIYQPDPQIDRYRLMRFPDAPGGAITIGAEDYETLPVALHEVFMRRTDDLLGRE